MRDRQRTGPNKQSSLVNRVVGHRRKDCGMPIFAGDQNDGLPVEDKNYLSLLWRTRWPVASRIVVIHLSPNFTKRRRDVRSDERRRVS